MTDKIIEIVKSILENDQISEKTLKEDIENWDSMNHLRIIFEIEEHYDIQIEPDEMNDFNSIENIKRIILKKINL